MECRVAPAAGDRVPAGRTPPQRPCRLRLEGSQEEVEVERTIPIIKLYGTLIVSIQVELSDRLVQELNDSIAEEIRQNDVRGLVVEVSGVGIFDSYIARAVRDLALVARLMGVRTVIAGLNAGVAITLVEMGSVLAGVRTARGLEEAVALLAEQSESLEEADEDGDEVAAQASARW
jgi:rsbT antagonist protein RsbS